MRCRSMSWRTSCSRSLDSSGGASDFRSGAASAALGIEFDFMFPHAEDGPAFGSEQAVDLEIPCHVAANLRAPEFSIGLRRHAVGGTRMPEAAVHKHDHARGDESEVRTPR